MPATLALLMIPSLSLPTSHSAVQDCRLCFITYWGWESDLLYSWYIQGCKVSKAYANETTFAAMVERTTSAITLKPWISYILLTYCCLKFALKSSCCSEPGIQVSLVIFFQFSSGITHDAHLLKESLFSLRWRIIHQRFPA